MERLSVASRVIICHKIASQLRRKSSLRAPWFCDCLRKFRLYILEPAFRGDCFVRRKRRELENLDDLEIVGLLYRYPELRGEGWRFIRSLNVALNKLEGDLSLSRVSQNKLATFAEWIGECLRGETCDRHNQEISAFSNHPEGYK